MAFACVQHFRKTDPGFLCSLASLVLCLAKRRSRQCEHFQQLVHVYETEPENTQKLMMLMQAVQEFGQPPADIIQDIAPGLELDEEGSPKLNSSGLPFPGNDEDCRIM